MIEVIRGSEEKPVSTKSLVDYFSARTDLNGTLYIGYPIVGTPSGSLSLDALLVSKEFGLVVFDIEEGMDVENRDEIRDTIFNNLHAKLIQYKELVIKRDLLVGINVVTYAPASHKRDLNDVISQDTELTTYLESLNCPTQTDDIYRNLISVIQTVTNIRRASKRVNVVKEDSRGGKLKKLEASIANLDRHQSAAVIETADGPQRIRGLAGSGKTIILALKVAYLHSRNPEWDIAVTFNTRTLKDQFIDLITKFTIEHRGEEPDWNKVKVLHAWGSPSSAGIYSEICLNYGLDYYNYRDAKLKDLSTKDAFGSACLYALEQLKEIENATGMFDAILVDEAQDFSGSFLQLCYSVLREPRRLIWAYDELQNLNEITIQSTKDLFGFDLHNEAGKAKQDIILEKCYRNSRPVLVTAQSIGFGIYREQGLVQMFDRPDLWREIGYVVEDGELDTGKHVTLKRTDDTSPSFLEDHSPIDDLLLFKSFKNSIDQSEWIASEIEKNLKEDELEYKDIIVINCDPLTTQKAVGRIREILFTKGIGSHVVGVTASPDKFYAENSVAFTGIYRAKGNEAAMVYVMNSDHSFAGYDLIKKRNILFTAITRSKAWVRVCGIGEKMDALVSEYKKAKDFNFTLEFDYPTTEEMVHLNVIHREMTRDEKEAVKQTQQSIDEVIRNLKEGKVRKEDLTPETLDMFRELIQDE